MRADALWVGKRYVFAGRNLFKARELHETADEYWRDGHQRRARSAALLTGKAPFEP